MSTSSGWRPTAAHARAVLGTLGLGAAAVLARRPDLVVLATPLLGAAVWAAVLRPESVPAVRQTVGRSTLREGDSTTCRVQVSDSEGRVEDVAAAFDVPFWVDQTPTTGQRVVGLREDGDTDLAIGLRPIRWGSHRIAPALVVASSAWNAFRYVSSSSSDAVQVLTLPQPAAFDAHAAGVRAPGLVGGNRSPRPGAGSDFATIRPFLPGDKLRRIHWPQSLRTGTLHAASTWADHDRHILLVVDAFEDVGESGGIDGRASSLDTALRAATAIAEYFIAKGDRVALMTIGAEGFHRLRPAVGRRHLRRMLEVMTRVRPANDTPDDGRMPRYLGAHALAVVLSPLGSVGAVQRLLTIADRGHDVVAVGCLPADIAEQDTEDPWAAIAWRIALLNRERQLRGVRSAGIAVVPWQGPGSLDVVLRSLGHGAASRAGRQ